MSRLQLLVRDFAQRNGIESLQPDDAGRYHITVDDEAHIHCFERFENLCLVSPLGPVPAPGESRQAWLKRLLNLALKLMKHGRGTPALTADGNAVLFTRFDIANLSVVELETRIAEHVNALETYRHALDVAATAQPMAAFRQSIVRP